MNNTYKNENPKLLVNFHFKSKYNEYRIFPGKIFQDYELSIIIILYLKNY